MQQNAVIDSFYTYNTHYYGLPWVCPVDPSGQFHFEREVGHYNAPKGKEGDLIVYNPVPGQVYAYGQKDYARDQTLKAFALWDGSRFIECDRTGAFSLPHRRTENEKPLPGTEQEGYVSPLQEAIDSERASREVSPVYPYPVKTRLFQHQVRGANMALLALGLMPYPGMEQMPKSLRSRGKGFGFLFEMGCGKSLAALAVAGAAYQMGAVRKVLVVAPASVCNVWIHELEDYAAYPFTAAILSGTKQARLNALKKLDEEPGDALKVAVINYESVWREGLFKAIMEWSADLVIADESQRIKTYNTKSSQAMHRLGEKARYKLALSGTPIQTNAMDLFSQYQYLDPAVFGNNYFSFRARYAVMGGYQDKQVIGYRRMDELIRKEYSIAYRVTKKDALDLPEQLFQTRYIQMEGTARKRYNELVEYSFMELEKDKEVTANTVLTKLLRLQQFTGGYVKPDDSDKLVPVFDGKLQALKDILEDYVLSAGKKLVIFCRFRPEILVISDLLKKMKIRFGCIFGDVKMETRGEIVQDFQNNPETRVFLAQIDTAGLGITLTAADTCVYYSVNYNYAAYSQSLSRIHRIGQKNACTYIHLVVEDTVDEHVLEALEMKEDLARTVVDSWRKYFRVRKKKPAGTREST